MDRRTAIQTRDILLVEAFMTAWFLNFVNDLFNARNAGHKEAAQWLVQTAVLQ